MGEGIKCTSKFLFYSEYVFSAKTSEILIHGYLNLCYNEKQLMLAKIVLLPLIGNNTILANMSWQINIFFIIKELHKC